MEKQTALDMIDSRIRGLKGTITWHNVEVEAYKSPLVFARKYEPKPIDEAAINREIARMKAARKDVLKRAN
jgi:hypothetical protein